MHTNTHTNQNKLGAIALSMLLLVATLPLAGCPSTQSTVAALTNTLGTAAAAIATLEGNTALATQLQTDTAAAVAAVQNWKTGSPAHNVIQALNIVVDDLDLICPTGICGPYGPLIRLALGTVQSIILLVDPGAVVSGTRGHAQRVTLTTPPKSSAQFKAQWNKICSQNPSLAPAALR